MEWYNGTVEMAIKKALSESKMFIVYIEGEDADSSKMNETWDCKMVCDVCCERNCVCIKIKGGSIEAEQFSKCYPILCIPSTYMINQSGIPVDIIAGYMEPEVFAQRLKQNLELKKLNESDIVKKEDKTDTDNCQASSNLHDDDNINSKQSTEMQSDKETHEDKVEHAKRTIEKQRIKKEKEERQEQLEREKKRRMIGQDIATAKKQQAEREAKKLMKEQAFEKAEAKAAREAIRQKILQDKAEKAARYESEKNELKKRHAKAQETTQEAPKSERFTSRIQFRLPDGSAITNEYPSKTTLDELTQSLIQQINWQHGSIRLATLYPKKEFTSEDMELSIKELNLVPSAVLIILPQKQQQKMPQNTSSSILDFIKFILAPIIGLLMYLKALMFGSEGQNQISNSEEAYKQKEKQQESLKAQTKPSQSTYKREGNVYQFKQDDDEDKDDKTWNGNSTQQM